MNKITTLRVIPDPYLPPLHTEEISEADDPINYESLVTERSLLLEAEYGDSFVNIQETEDDLSDIRQRDTDTQVAQTDS